MAKTQPGERLPATVLSAVLGVNGARLLNRILPGRAAVAGRSAVGEACLSVCFRCKPEGSGGEADARRPGADLAEAIEAEAARRHVDRALLRDVRCMSQCKRPCVIAFSGAGRFTYLFGDLRPDDASAVLDAFALYGRRPDGFMERFERPEALRAGVLGRVPPLIPGARQVERRPAPVGAAESTL